MIDPYELAMNVFRLENVWIHNQCIKLHHFQSFLTAFPSVKRLYSSIYMPIIDCIKGQKEGKTEAYAFAASMFNESLCAENQSVFKNLSVVQMSIEKGNDQ